MAVLFPDFDPEKISKKPERDVARALVRDLPSDCLIYHSYCWLRRDVNGKRETLHEGETDFLILDPAFGLLVLEVKGGDIRHRVENGKDVYFRALPNGQERDPGNPFEQARKSIHTIEKILQLKDDSNWFGGCYGYAVAFPDQTNKGALPNDADNSIVFLAEHLDDMGRAVRGAFKRWNRKQNPCISPEQMRLCRERLRPIFGLVPALWRKIEKDEEQLVTLTVQQQQVMEGLTENRRLAVKGGAGTGKTMLALWRAIEFAKEGKDTLFLCFNKYLAQWLNDRVNHELDVATKNKLLITTFHSLCWDFYRRAGIPFSPPQNTEQKKAFWSKAVPEMMFDVLLNAVPSLRFDAIIVDEAQDFQSDWWIVIESLSREHSSRLILFYDPNQNVYKSDNLFPQTETVYNLKVNCRNTREIHDFSAQFINADTTSSPRVPHGIAPIEVTVTDAQDQRDKCEKFLKQWKNDYRIEPNRIAILSSLTLSNSCFGISSRVAGMDITTDLLQWKNAEGVLFSSLTAFKGLEADAIVLLKERMNPPSASDLYVATSRAKHLLAVISLE
ncbi:MAG: hypothetical protein RLY14_2022 [Planctomycetota bacterium]|jgi:hypothetical protein